ncbi:MAG: damage-control phosphatase ARMT1 family protein [Anaerolineae bacterium]
MVEHAPPVPPPLMTSEPGSFAEATIMRRKPHILDEVLQDNDYPDDIRAALEALRREIVMREEIRPLIEGTPDRDEWEAQWCPYRGRNWLDVPWYFAEAFFYRRLLEATRYFQPGRWQGHDPFAVAKRRQISGPGGALALAAALMSELPNEPLVAARELVYASLWGNRVDLSNREVLAGVAALGGHPRDLLIDDSAELVQWLAGAAPHERVDLVCDNAGPEATFDLLLADHLLEQGWARTVRLHLKAYPFFVSDAMVKDVRELIARLEGETEARSRIEGDRLAGRLREGTLQLRDHSFWTSAYDFSQLPEDLRAELAQADLVILKGDANYRRLLGDRHWPTTARMEEIAGYFPAPLAVLRTLKAEIMVGLEQGQAEMLAQEDPQWLINGRRGLIQLVGVPTPQTPLSPR